MPPGKNCTQRVTELWNPRVRYDIFDCTSCCTLLPLNGVSADGKICDMESEKLFLLYVFYKNIQ